MEIEQEEISLDDLRKQKKFPDREKLLGLTRALWELRQRMKGL